MKKQMMTLLAAIGLSLASSPAAMALKLVPDATIKKQKKETQIFKLKNGIPVIYREVPGSDIIHLEYSFRYGLKDQPEAEKAYTDIMFTVMSMAAKDWPKIKVFSTTEKYSAALGCTAGIEMSSCSLDTINDYWDELLPLFAAIVKEPSFNDEDIKLTIARKQAELKGNIENPDNYVNDVVNRVYYPKNHPYWLSIEQNLDQLKKVSRPDLVKLHDKVLSAKIQQIVVVGSLPLKQVKADLAKNFAGLKAAPVELTKVEPPKFDLKSDYSLEDRNIPTAYIRIKTNAPGITEKDATAAKLMFKILDEELGDEIRTKRSLSYAVFSFMIDYKVGIGVISATTSKPKETLEAMQVVFDKLKNHKYTKDELEIFKTVYATSYYLTQEEHSSLGSAMATYYRYFDSVDPLYEMPRRLAKVSSGDVQRMAKKYLVDFRMGVIYDQKKFKKDWADKLIESSIAKK